MKNLLSVLFFLFFTIAHSQLTFQQLNKLTEVQAKSFADQIAGNSKTKWELISAKTSSKGDYYIVKYVNAAASKVIKQEAQDGVSCDDCLKVRYTIYYDGENKDLDKPGVKTFKFYDVYGKYLDLFPTWKNTFRPDADLEKTIDHINSREVINRPVNINFRFNQEGDFWSIRNFA